MSEQGAALQCYNQELVKGIETMKKRRSDLMLLIRKDEQSKEELEKELASVKRRLNQVCDTLNERLQKKAFYDDAIENSEAAYSKILESSQALLHVVRQDAQAMLDSAGDTKRDSRT